MNIVHVGLVGAEEVLARSGLGRDLTKPVGNRLRGGEAIRDFGSPLAAKDAFQTLAKLMVVRLDAAEKLRGGDAAKPVGNRLRGAAPRWASRTAAVGKRAS